MPCLQRSLSSVICGFPNSALLLRAYAAFVTGIACIADAKHLNNETLGRRSRIPVSCLCSLPLSAHVQRESHRDARPSLWRHASREASTSPLVDQRLASEECLICLCIETHQPCTRRPKGVDHARLVHPHVGNYVSRGAVAHSRIVQRHTYADCIRSSPNLLGHATPKP